MSKASHPTGLTLVQGSKGGHGGLGTTLSIPVLRVMISALKGGIAKTTTTIMLAMALAEMGYRVVVLCMDPKSQGSRDWFRKATALAQQGMGRPVPFALESWESVEASGRPAKWARLQEERHSDAQVFLADTGGESPDVFASLAQWADEIMTPIGSERAELARMHATYDAAAEIAENRNRPLLISALLTRVPQPGRGSAEDARDMLDGTLWKQEEEAGVPEELREGLEMHVRETEINRNKSTYSDVYGTVPDSLGAYVKLAQEIVKPYTTPQQGDTGTQEVTA